MAARWSHLPTKTKAVKTRRKPQRHGTWRCAGVGGCGATLDHGWEDAQRHSDGHHGSRLDLVL